MRMEVGGKAVMSQDLRWKQRYQHFERAVSLLHEPIARGIDGLSDLEKEGTIQRFEMAVELAWKTLKDFLEHEGKTLEPVTPRSVIKEAFAAQIIDDGQVWIDLLDHRNLLSHSYDADVCDQAVEAIRDRYFAALQALGSWFKRRVEAAK